jgi:MFS transporter, TsgA protein
LIPRLNSQIKLNIKNPALIAYLAGLFVGGAIAILGTITPNIAQTYNVTSSLIVQIDTLILIGLLAGNIKSSSLIKKFGDRQTLVITCLIMGSVWVILPFLGNLLLYGVAVFLSGLSMGILLPVVNYIVFKTYSDKGLADSKLNILNSFIGFGSFLGPALAGHVTHHYSWGKFVFFAGTVYLIVMALVMFVRFRSDNTVREKSAKVKVENTHVEKAVNSRPITKIVLFVGFALFMYIYVEYIISYWFSPYMADSLGYNAQVIGFMIGGFWLSVAIGRFVFGKFVLPKVSKDYVFIVTAVACTIIGFLIFLSTSNLYAIGFSVIFLGLGCASLFPTLIGIGMNGSTKASPTTMAFLMGASSLGGIVSLLVAPTIGTMFSKKVAIYTAPFGCIMVIIFILFATYACTEN